MTEPTKPKAWANVLAKAWGNQFPVDVRQIAIEYSQVRYKDEPIGEIVEADVGDSFEGCLAYAPNRKEWLILYNPSISPPRRVNFTLAHELGHYLVHRQLRDMFQCSQRNLIGFGGGESGRDIEQEANEFASFLLMPANDFRAQTDGNEISIDLLDHCADRYEVTLTAAALKWLDVTREKAMLVVSRDQFILWSRSSNPAFSSYIYFRSGTPVPERSLTYHSRAEPRQAMDGFNIPAGVWHPNAPVKEYLIISDRYDMTITLLVFPKSADTNHIKVSGFE